MEVTELSPFERLVFFAIRYARLHDQHEKRLLERLLSQLEFEEGRAKLVAPPRSGDSIAPTPEEQAAHAAAAKGLAAAIDDYIDARIAQALAKLQEHESSATP